MQFMELIPVIQSFAAQVAIGQVEIYNEASVQYELAILLRQRLGSAYKVQLERNISYFFENKGTQSFRKKEMDIVVFDSKLKAKHCIELKYPLNRQVPVQMFRACEDVKFLEQLVLSGFDKSYFIMFAKDSVFYSDSGNSGIYRSFRKEKLIKGVVEGTTGKVKGEKLYFKGNYPIRWKGIREALKYFVVEVTNIK
jgi:hypothetical protein